MKVRESQIPEESSKSVKVDEDNNLIPDISADNDGDKKYVRSVIFLPDFGLFVSIFDISTIEKDMRFVEHPRPRWQYGITINKGITSPNIVVKDKSVWFEKEEYRDKRFNGLMEKLEDFGFKVINV
mgnify:CR=1 FL=1